MQTQTIQELRKAHGWTQQDLAVKVGVSLATVYNWERGRYEPRASQLRSLAFTFGVPMEAIALLGEDQLKTVA